MCARARVALLETVNRAPRIAGIVDRKGQILSPRHAAPGGARLTLKCCSRVYPRLQSPSETLRTRLTTALLLKATSIAIPGYPALLGRQFPRLHGPGGVSSGLPNPVLARVRQDLGFERPRRPRHKHWGQAWLTNPVLARGVLVFCDARKGFAPWQHRTPGAWREAMPAPGPTRLFHRVLVLGRKAPKASHHSKTLNHACNPGFYDEMACNLSRQCCNSSRQPR